MDIFDKINEVLQNVELDNVTSESNGDNELPDGYYNCEVKKAEIKESKTSHQPQIAFSFAITEDGVTGDVDEQGNVQKTPIPKTKGRYIFIYYPLTDEKQVKRFVSDMLKFEGDEPGVPLLDKEYFTNSEVLEQALDVLIGSRIWINLSTTKNQNGEYNQWRNLISWKRISQLEIDA